MLGIIFAIAVLVVIAYLYLYFSTSQKLKEKNLEEIRQQERVQQEQEQNNNVPATGFSRYVFEMIKSPDLCEESEELFAGLKEGDFLTLMICPYLDINKVYVNVGLMQIGTAEQKAYRFLFDKINSGNYVCCRCLKLLKEYGQTKVLCEFFYYDTFGKFDYLGLANTWIKSAMFVPGTECPDTVDVDKHLFVSKMGLIINKMEDAYYKNGVAIFTGITKDVMDEDNYFIGAFVRDYLRGGINSEEDLNEFLRECATERQYGNNSVLKKRLDAFIHDVGIEFIF